MLLGGLWHGAAWNYVLWGAYQGRVAVRPPVLDAYGRETLPTSIEAVSGTTDLHGGAVRRSAFFQAGFPPHCASSLFFIFCCYGWLLFRAHSFDQIKTFSVLLFGFGAGGPSVISKPTTSALLGIVVLSMLQLCDYQSGSLESFRAGARRAGPSLRDASLHIDHGYKQCSRPVYLFSILTARDEDPQAARLQRRILVYCAVDNRRTNRDGRNGRLRFPPAGRSAASRIRTATLFRLWSVD